MRPDGLYREALRTEARPRTTRFSAGIEELQGKSNLKPSRIFFDLAIISDSSVSP
jgi:hypothetical protein